MEYLLAFALFFLGVIVCVGLIARIIIGVLEFTWANAFLIMVLVGALIFLW